MPTRLRRGLNRDSGGSGPAASLKPSTVMRPAPKPSRAAVARKAVVLPEPEDQPLRQAERARRLQLYAGDGLEGAPVDFALVSRVVQAEAEERRGEGGETHNRREAVVEDEELEEKGRPADELDIAGERAL